MLKVWLALGPSEEPQSDSGFNPDRIKDTDKQVGVNNNSSELIRDPSNVTKSPGLFFNGIEDKVSVMGLRDWSYAGASGAVVERRN
jgi:hypothetical protein